MRPSGATFWRLGGLSGWQGKTASSDLAVSDQHGLRLEAAANGPLALSSGDGSLGGLVLPRGMAFDDENTLYLLGPTTPWIKKFDPETRAFQTLPEVGGGGTEPRRFSGPTNIACSRGRLFVADAGNRRVQVFDTASLVLLELWDASGEREDWSPVDVAAHEGSVYILDAARGRIFRHTRTGHLLLAYERSDRAWKWSRVIVDNTGTLYLLNTSVSGAPTLETADSGSPRITDPGAVRDRFTTPAIRLDERGRFCVPESLARVCDRQQPSVPSSEVQLALCSPFNRKMLKCQSQPTRPRSTRTAQGAWLLYVVEREQRRVDAYTDTGKRLRHSWGECMDWQPADVTARGAFAFILDEQNQVVYRHTAGRHTLRQVVRGDATTKYWTRIAIDEHGCVLLYAPGQVNVQVFECTGAPQRERCYREVAKYFEAASPAAPVHSTAGLIFDREGEPAVVDPSQPSGIPLYRTTGRWQSVALDSKKYRCQWHRIELGLTNLPPGSKVHVSTYSHQNKADVDSAPDVAWQDAYTVVAPVQPPMCQTRVPPVEFLVQSGGGQYLSIRITLESDGFSSAAVDNMKVHYPRESYLQYLPATYSSDDEGRLFLERFLAIFQTEWDAMDKQIDQQERLFDPDAVPAGPFLDYLARQWMAVPLEGTWTYEQKRRLISATPKIYRHRGQLEGLRELVAVYLANMAGLETRDVESAGFPVILEGFRERQHMIASDGEASRLGFGAPLWSASMVRRLQLGVFSREGEVELVSTGDPEHDIFDRYAHRFRVMVPAGWVRTSAAESLLRRAIDSEKPAQTAYDLCLVAARFRVEAQSTVGVDTVIGDVPTTVLACSACDESPPSLPPTGRLGYDSVLCEPNGRAVRQVPTAIVGQGTLLA